MQTFKELCQLESPETQQPSSIKLADSIWNYGEIT